MSAPEEPGKIRSASDLLPAEAEALKVCEQLYQCREDVTIHLHPISLLFLVSHLQLALRHPSNTGASADQVRTITRQWQAALVSRFPDLAALMEAGWCVENDTAWGEAASTGPEEQSSGPPAAFETDIPIPKNLFGRLGFSETQGRGHVGGPECPWCAKLLPAASCQPNGRGACPHCKKLFSWMAGPTPCGFAYSTFQYPPQREEKGGPIA